ncbi:hypothetical protein AB1Y20_004873 [Prymnesium parvum]|uniref:Uncharacterized protein n=1 Tax=Prymnesium parvum TaxID=97485 RepID=A0AB34J0E6_PRYPA
MPRHHGCRTSPALAVHLALIARGSVQLKGALSTAANVQIWSDEPERICFHVFVGSEAQQELAETPLDHLAAKAQLQFALSDVLRFSA